MDNYSRRMGVFMDRIIFHVDVNSAFLSWSAIDRLKRGEEQDLRELIAVIGHDEARGVVLAKSEGAKKLKITTGESIQTAKRKYPELVIVQPDFSVYERNSQLLVELLRGYTPNIEQYSIDECFLDMTRFLEDTPVATAQGIRERIQRELGFTVNIGISSNKVLAKMGSDLKKPNRVHTLFPNEMKMKLWPQPVENLFMVGRRSTEKLHEMGIFTIGELAAYNEFTLKKIFKSYGGLIYRYANGIDDSPVESNDDYEIKIISNSTTVKVDITSRVDARKALLSLVENVAARLRKSGRYCGCVAVTIRNAQFKDYSHQRKLPRPTDSTKQIYEEATELFDKLWKGEPIRLLGVALSHLEYEAMEQLSLFTSEQTLEKNKALDRVIDDLRNKFGEQAVVRSVFINSKK